MFLSQTHKNITLHFLAVKPGLQYLLVYSHSQSILLPQARANKNVTFPQFFIYCFELFSGFCTKLQFLMHSLLVKVKKWQSKLITKYNSSLKHVQFKQTRIKLLLASQNRVIFTSKLCIFSEIVYTVFTRLFSVYSR